MGDLMLRAALEAMLEAGLDDVLNAGYNALVTEYCREQGCINWRDSCDGIDRQLADKYELNDAERKFMSTRVKPMADHDKIDAYPLPTVEEMLDIVTCAMNAMIRSDRRAQGLEEDDE